MASGLRAATKHSSAKSLGSFVELGSASSSDFEPIDLEEEEMSAQADSFAKTSQQGSVMGKNTTPPVAPPPLKTVPEQSEIKSSPERSGEGGQAFPEPLQEGLQNLENATHKAAEMAKDFTNKLFISGAAEARSSVMRLAGDVSSWWAALDPVPKQPSESPQDTTRSAQGNSEVQDLFGLPEEEELMERFACSIVQTMECLQNSFSKPQHVRCPGRLYITNRNSCFTADGMRFAIPHKDVQAISKVQGSSAKALRLDFGSAEENVLFEGFRGMELDSALALLEHVTE